MSIVCLLTIFQIIIAYSIKKYYDALPNSDDRERMRLTTTV